MNPLDTQKCSKCGEDKLISEFGKGIAVCDDWHIFENFLRDMGERPKGHQIDRIDFDRDYYKENCRWVESSDNQRNKSSNIIIEHLGKQQCLKVWCDELELPYKAVYHRFKYKNQTDPKILFRPIRRKQCVL